MSYSLYRSILLPRSFMCWIYEYEWKLRRMCTLTLFSLLLILMIRIEWNRSTDIDNHHLRLVNHEPPMCMCVLVCVCVYVRNFLVIFVYLCLAWKSTRGFCCSTTMCTIFREMTMRWHIKRMRIVTEERR